MSTTPDWGRRYAAEFRDHWWWRPGWTVGTRFYTWYLTFHGYRELHALVDRYQAVLAQHVGFDLVPRRRLHLTMQGIAHSESVSNDQLDAILDATGSRLRALGRVEVHFHRPVLWPEAVTLPALPPEGPLRVRAALREAIGETLGAEAIPDFPDGSRPHISLAYSTRVQPSSPVAAALDVVEAGPASVPVKSAVLVELHRDQRMYRWRTLAEVPVAGP
jgi:2'-5' RNA ligase